MIYILKKLKPSGLCFLLLSLVMMIIQVRFDLKIPDLMSDMTLSLQNDSSNIKEILRIGGKMMIYTMGSVMIALLSSIFIAKISTGFSADIRKDLFYRTQDFSFAEIKKFSIPSLIVRATNDIVNVETMLVMGILIMFKAPITAIMATGKIRNLNKEWGMPTIITVVVVIVLSITALLSMYNKSIRLQKMTDDVNMIARENYSGTYTIRAYNYEKYRNDKFRSHNDQLAHTEKVINDIMTVMTNMIMISVSILTVVIYVIGAVIINKCELEDKIIVFSQMIVFSTYALQIISAIVMFITIFIMLPRAMVSYKRIKEIIDERISILSGRNKIEGIDSIEFRNVDFMYPDGRANALTDLSFKVKKGETLAVIGATGCGKSTLVNLLMRFYDATRGKILINDKDIKEYDIKSFRSNIGYVPQKTFMFGGTVSSNIAYNSDEIDRERLNKVCEAACVDDFVQVLPDGTDSKVEKEGSNYSGGQKQRMSIARALYNSPDLLIFDDSFSALDFKTDKRIRNNIKNYCQNAIKVIVAQRISTVIDADTIIVVDDGKIVGMGNHEELMKNCTNYQQFAYAQISGGEINE